MVEPLLEAETEWIETDDGKRLRWICPQCESEYLNQQRYATTTCEECDRMMEARDYDASGRQPDPQNPKPVLRAIARSRGMPPDYYVPDEDEKTTQDPLEF